MIVLTKITWQDFQKIIQLIQEYNNSEFDSLLEILKHTKKQACNIKVDNFSKENLYKIIVIVDMWNTISNEDYNKDYDLISSKLQKAYFKTFNEYVFPET